MQKKTRCTKGQKKVLNAYKNVIHGKKNKQKHSLDAPQNILHVKRWAVHGKSVKCMPDAKTHQQVKEKTCKAYVRCMPTNTA